MIRRHFLLLSAMFFAGSLHAAPASSVAKLPPGTKRVLFLGDSITHAGGYAVDVETYFALRYPKHPMTFINAGVPSETVSGLSEENHAGGAFPRPTLFERLDRVLPAIKPDLVFTTYGINDGIYKPFDQERFKAFQDGMKKLHAAVEKSGAKIIHVTPPTYDGKGKNNAYEEVMERYSKWLLDQRKSGWQVLDVNGPMTAYLKTQRKTNPDFQYAKDGVHPDDSGHWIIAQQILVQLGATDIASIKDQAEFLATDAKGQAVYDLVKQRMPILRDAWISETRTLRPGLPKGLPVPEAEKKAADIQSQIDALLQ
jgi:lysophospholipase L1-like esterase